MLISCLQDIMFSELALTLKRQFKNHTFCRSVVNDGSVCFLFTQLAVSRDFKQTVECLNN